MRTILHIQNIHTFIEGPFPKTEVDKALSYYTSGFFMSPKFRLCQRCSGGFQKINPKSGRCPKCNMPRIWDGRKRLLLGGRASVPYFPTGCLPIVADILERSGVPADYKDERSPCLRPNPEEACRVVLLDPKNPGGTRTPWERQQEAIFAGLKYERGVIQTPTSGGKTTIMAALAKLIPEPAVVLINNKSIAKQLQDEISGMLGEEVGLIMGNGVFEPRRVTVAMTQSLTNLLSLDSKSKKEKLPPFPEAVEFVKRIRLLMFDEAHHTSSDTWFNLAKAMINAYYRFGVTGTPFMRAAGDDLLLIGATGGLIYEVPEQVLIAEGKIARPIIHWYKIPHPCDIPSDAKYPEAYDLGVTHNLYLNRLAALKIKEFYDEDSQILILCEKLDHIKNLETELHPSIEYAVLTGEDEIDRREEVKSEFIAGKLKVIIATKIFDEGVSIENIDHVFRMGLMKTSIKTKQQVGRGQRLKKDKPQVVHIHDFMHVTHRYLTEHSYAHFKMYQDLDYEQILEPAPEGLDCQETLFDGVQSKFI